MTISKREKNLLMMAGLVVCGFLIIFVIVPKLRVDSAGTVTAEDRDSLASLYQDVKRKEKLAQELEARTEALSVKIPSESPDDQVQNFVNVLETVGGKNGIGYTTLQPKTVTPGRAARARRPGSKVSYDLRFSAEHAKFVTFIQGLEEEGVPFVIESLDMKNEGGPGKLAVVMEISFYLLEPMEHEKDA